MMIITNEEQLKNPVIVYAVMNQWMCEAGEDLIDCNESYINGDKILEWMLKKGYVTKEKHDQVIENEETWIQDLLLGYKTGVLNGECNFPSNNKAYQVIAEYISEHKSLREEFIYLFCFPICSHIDDFDLQEGTMSKEDWLKERWFAEISYTDEYNCLKNMTFEECDSL